MSHRDTDEFPRRPPFHLVNIGDRPMPELGEK